MKLKFLMAFFVIMGLFSSCSLDLTDSQKPTKSKAKIEQDEDGYIVELGTGLDIDSLNENQNEELPIRSYKFFGGNTRAPSSTDEAVDKSLPETYQNYEIKKGDTLLSIAYRLYGDYRRWREILHENEAIGLNARSLEPGTIIRYMPPEVPPQWPEGTSYVVKKK